MVGALFTKLGIKKEVKRDLETFKRSVKKVYNLRAWKKTGIPGALET